MAFVQANLSLVSYSGNGFHIWHYKTAGDALNTIDTAGYYQPDTAILAKAMRPSATLNSIIDSI